MNEAPCDDGRQCPPLETLPVPELVSRAQRGSLPCFSELVTRFEGRLLNFLLRKTGSTHDAEDLAQEAFVRAWRRVEQYDPRWQFSTWLFTIAHRLAITQHRRRDVATSCDALDLAPVDGHDPARLLAERERGGQLWETADRILTETQRTALWLRYAEDLSNADIAAITGRSRVSVRVTLFRAREALAAHERAGPEGRSEGQTAVPDDDIQAAGLTRTITGDLVC